MKYVQIRTGSEFGQKRSYLSSLLNWIKIGQIRSYLSYLDIDIEFNY
jgi:hypothetical protein